MLKEFQSLEKQSLCLEVSSSVCQQQGGGAGLFLDFKDVYPVAGWTRGPHMISSSQLEYHPGARAFIFILLVPLESKVNVISLLNSNPRSPAKVVNTELLSRLSEASCYGSQGCFGKGSGPNRQKS